MVTRLHRVKIAPDCRTTAGTQSAGNWARYGVWGVVGSRTICTFLCIAPYTVAPQHLYKTLMTGDNIMIKNILVFEKKIFKVQLKF